VSVARRSKGVRVLCFAVFRQEDAPKRKFIVHGHTPVVEPDLRSNRINIDIGAYATGRLTCIRIERDQLSATSVTCRSREKP
jgi:hypothetical protein